MNIVHPQSESFLYLSFIAGNSFIAGYLTFREYIIKNEVVSLFKTNLMFNWSSYFGSTLIGYNLPMRSKVTQGRLHNMFPPVPNYDIR